MDCTNTSGPVQASAEPPPQQNQGIHLLQIRNSSNANFSIASCALARVPPRLAVATSRMTEGKTHELQRARARGWSTHLIMTGL